MADKETYAQCDHQIEVGHEVLAVYAEGDCDAGVVMDVLHNGWVIDVRLPGGMRMNFCVEDVVHSKCPDLELFEREPVEVAS